MRLKIKIAGGFLRKTGKDRACYKHAVIQLWVARVLIIEHHKTDKLRVLGRKVTGERNDILSLFISASGINFLRSSGFSGDSKTGNGCGGSGPAVAHDAPKRIPNFF